MAIKTFPVKIHTKQSAHIATSTVDLSAHRQRRLRSLINREYGRSQKALGDAAGLNSQAVSNALSESSGSGRGMGERKARNWEKLLNLESLYFDKYTELGPHGEYNPTPEDDPAFDPNDYQPRHLDYVSPLHKMGKVPTHTSFNIDPPHVRVDRVELQVEAGATGFVADASRELSNPLFFSVEWLTQMGLKADSLLGFSVQGYSMGPGLMCGDVVVFDTSDTGIQDGKVYMINFEGEVVVKRLIRNENHWWLHSDNVDQARFPRRAFVKGCFIIGRVVHKQSSCI